MITTVGILKLLSFLLGVVLMINLLRKDSEYNKEDNNINY